MRYFNQVHLAPDRNILADILHEPHIKITVLAQEIISSHGE